SNADGQAVSTGAEAVSRLVSQVTSPVRFDACLATMRELGVAGAIEPPAPRLATPAPSPVRFAPCLATMRELGATAVIELPPAGALAGLAKREWKGARIEVLPLTGPRHLDRARQRIVAERG